MAGCCCASSSSSHVLLHGRCSLLTSSTSIRPSSATLRPRRAPHPQRLSCSFSQEPPPLDVTGGDDCFAAAADRRIGFEIQVSKIGKRNRRLVCTKVRVDTGTMAPPAPLAPTPTPTPVVRRRGVAPAGRFRLFCRRAAGGVTVGTGPPPCASACACDARGRGGNGATQGVAAGVPVDVPAYFFFASHMESFHLLNLLARR
jgi:hypothetical protein